MLHNLSAEKFQENSQHDLSQREIGKVILNNSHASPLSSEVNSAINTVDKMGRRRVRFALDEKEDTPAKESWLKYLLIGASVVTVGGLLSVGSYYLIGKGHGHHSPENAMIPHSEENPAMIVYGDSSGSPVNGQEAGISADIILEKSISPYSYYEGIYENMAVQHKTLPPVTAQEPVSEVVKKLRTKKSTITVSTVSKPDALLIKHSRERGLENIL